MENELRAIDIQELKEKAKSQIVKLPGFSGEKDCIHVEMKRVSLLSLATAGGVPNELLGAVNSLYMHGIKAQTSIEETAKVFKIIAKAALANPTYAELEKEGIELTDEQLLHIYLYAISGVRAFTNFR